MTIATPTPATQPCDDCGDYPCRVRIIVTNESPSSEIADGVVWGFRSRYYSSASTAALIYPATSLLNAGTNTTLAGSQFSQVVNSASPGEISQLQLSSSGHPALTHRGSYRVMARVYANNTGGRLSLSWAPSYGGTQTTNAPAVIPGSGAFYLVDLGTIRLDPPPVGTSIWFGQVNATGATRVYTDYFMFVPLDEGAGEASGEILAATGGIAEIRSEGTYFGVAGNYAAVAQTTGDLPRIPPSGLEQRPVELLVRPSSEYLADPAATTDQDLLQFTVQVVYRPCWLSRP